MSTLLSDFFESVFPQKDNQKMNCLEKVDPGLHGRVALDLPMYPSLYKCLNETDSVISPLISDAVMNSTTVECEK